jgi:hypothetical protein
MNGGKRITIPSDWFDAESERHASIDQRRKPFRLVLGEGGGSEAEQETRDRG